MVEVTACYAGNESSRYRVVEGRILAEQHPFCGVVLGYLLNLRGCF